MQLTRSARGLRHRGLKVAAAKIHNIAPAAPGRSIKFLDAPQTPASRIQLLLLDRLWLAPMCWVPIALIGQLLKASVGYRTSCSNCCCTAAGINKHAVVRHTISELQRIFPYNSKISPVGQE